MFILPLFNLNTALAMYIFHGNIALLNEFREREKGEYSEGRERAIEGEGRREVVQRGSETEQLEM